MKILWEKTDEENGLSMSEILTELENFYDIKTERKSIYDDIDALKVFSNLKIEKSKKGKSCEYKLTERIFETVHLKLLIDAIQSSKFITESKSNDLIKRLKTLASKNDIKKLNRNVYATKVKSINEDIYKNTDTIHLAISSNKKIKFKYFNWNVDKNKEFHKNGEFYTISPWALTWDNGNYYLIGYDEDAIFFDDDIESKGILKNFRVDKMVETEIIPDTERIGDKEFENFDISEYINRRFRMFNGEETSVKIKFKNNLAGVVIDRFGKDTPFVEKTDDYFVARINVAVSLQFLSWVIALGDGTEIISPQNVVDEMKEEIKRLSKLYNVCP